MITIKCNYIDIPSREIYYAEIGVKDEIIVSIVRLDNQKNGALFMLPGFIDAHIHIESSMLVPSQFGKLAITHGTVATVSDPHEIANVLGVRGVEYMIEDGKRIPFHFYFGAPSCVPATSFESAGAVIDSQDIKKLLKRDDIVYLAEMMNFPGVIHRDEEIIKKLQAAKDVGKVIDGHAPGLRGEEAKAYFAEGISTDHECFTIEEAKEKLGLGVKVLIREGSAAKNFAALIPLAHEHYDQMMFCSDDKHPDDLVDGHINQLVSRAIIKHNLDLFKALRMACINPVLHYGLDVGLCRKGDAADFIMVEDLQIFKVDSTYIKGEKVAAKGKSLIEVSKPEVINNFNTNLIKVSDIASIITKGKNRLRVIHVHDGQLITSTKWVIPKILGGMIVSDLEEDILKIVVYNRYQTSPPAVGFIHGFGLKNGALASSVAHDSHNIIAVGTNDEDICKAINSIVECQGGISMSHDIDVRVLPLPIAGLMSDKNGYEVAKEYHKIDAATKDVLKSSLTSPYMSLSFMALLVIPELKLSDKGLFSGATFDFVDLME